MKKKADKKRKRGAKSKGEPKMESTNFSAGELFITEYCSPYAVGKSKKGWYVDGGASKHMSNKKEWFKNIGEVELGSKVIVGDS